MQKRILNLVSERPNPTHSPGIKRTRYKKETEHILQPYGPLIKRVQQWISWSCWVHFA